MLPNAYSERSGPLHYALVLGSGSGLGLGLGSGLGLPGEGPTKPSCGMTQMLFFLCLDHVKFAMFLFPDKVLQRFCCFLSLT